MFIRKKRGKWKKGKQHRKKIREIVINRDGLICCYCESELTHKTVTMEHIIPKSKSGTLNPNNLTVACEKCNNKRDDKDFFEYCKMLNFNEDKIKKYEKLYSSYKHLYLNNLKMKKILQNVC